MGRRRLGDEGSSKSVKFSRKKPLSDPDLWPAREKSPDDSVHTPRVCEKTAGAHPRVARHRAKLTPFAAAIVGCIERALLRRKWPRIPSEIREKAIAEAARLTKKDRCVYVDHTNRLWKGKLIEEHQPRNKVLSLIVLQRLYRPDAKTDVEAVPALRVFRCGDDKVTQ